MHCNVSDVIDVMQTKSTRNLTAAALAAILLTQAAHALAQDDIASMPVNSELESSGEGPWADLTYEEHLLKATIEGASRGPASETMQSLFEDQTGSSELVEVRAERQKMIDGQPGCAVVFLYFVQEGVPVLDESGEEVDTTTIEVRQNMARCANGDIPHLPGEQRPDSMQ